MRSAEEILKEAGIPARRVEVPGSQEEVASLVALARKDRMRILPLGGGTSIGLAPVPEEGVDLVLDMRGLNTIRELDPGNLNMVVDAGKTIEEINRELAQVGRGFMLPLDPPRCHEVTLGGCYAANSSGPLRHLYGTMRDLALGVKGVNSEGKEVGFGGVTVKNVSGYDLTKFLIGSAGSLAIVTSVALRILPIPDASAMCEISFQRGSDLQGFLRELRGSVLLPSALVVTWKTGDEALKVVIGLEGHPKAVERQGREILDMANRHGGEGQKIEGREAMEGGLRNSVDPKRLTSQTMGLKVGVAIAKGLELMLSIEDLAAKGQVEASFSLLAGNGIGFVYATDSSTSVLEEMAKKVREIASEKGGHVVPLFGPRQILLSWGPRMDARLGRKTLKPIKQLWDPEGLLLPLGL